jgi:putative FmdB family regulatory protein
MPIYEYECGKCSSRFEVKQSFHDEAKAACKKCGSPARRIFKPVPIMFKGSGFYITDSGGKKDHLVDTNGNGKDKAATAVPESKAAESPTTADSTKKTEPKSTNTKTTDTKAAEAAAK